MCAERDDPSEQILSGIERATGGRPEGCPWQAFRDPFVGAVLRAYRWFRSGQLAVAYPDLPAALARGLEVYDAALNAVQAYDIREERKRREAERQERELASQAAKRRRR